MHDINSEEAVECLQTMVIIKFFNCPKQIPRNLIPMILQTKVSVADITEKMSQTLHFGKHICYHSLFLSVLLTVAMSIFPVVTCLNMKL